MLFRKKSNQARLLTNLLSSSFLQNSNCNDNTDNNLFLITIDEPFSVIISSRQSNNIYLISSKMKNYKVFIDIEKIYEILLNETTIIICHQNRLIVRNFIIKGISIVHIRFVYVIDITYIPQQISARLKIFGIPRPNIKPHNFLGIQWYNITV